MREYPSGPIAMVSSLWANRQLIHLSAVREVVGRYRGSAMGLLWSFFNPLLMLAVYTFVFSEIFKARWGEGTGSKTEFALILFAGLIIFNLFAECINRAPSLILANPNFVKKVVYPLEILPFVSLLGALYHSFVSFCVWMLAYVVIYGAPHITVVYFPLILIPFCLFVLGIGWALSSLGVYLRDVSQFVGVLTTVLMFLSPLFYPVSALSESYRRLLYVNPLTPVIEQTRAVLFWGQAPDFRIIGVYWLATILMAWAGFVWFQRTRRGFADVL